MKAEGWKFPPVREAEAMFEADTAPDWEEGTFVNMTFNQNDMSDIKVRTIHLKSELHNTFCYFQEMYVIAVVYHSVCLLGNITAVHADKFFAGNAHQRAVLFQSLV